LTYFNHLLITGYHYDKCVGCSDHVRHPFTVNDLLRETQLVCVQVVQEYTSKGVEFIKSVCNNPLLLEDITGITKMKQESQDVKMEWDGSDDDL